MTVPPKFHASMLIVFDLQVCLVHGDNYVPGFVVTSGNMRLLCTVAGTSIWPSV